MRVTVHSPLVFPQGLPKELATRFAPTRRFSAGRKPANFIDAEVELERQAKDSCRNTPLHAHQKTVSLNVPLTGGRIGQKVVSSTL